MCNTISQLTDVELQNSMQLQFHWKQFAVNYRYKVNFFSETFNINYKI